MAWDLMRIFGKGGDRGVLGQKRESWEGCGWYFKKVKCVINLCSLIIHCIVVTFDPVRGIASHVRITSWMNSLACRLDWLGREVAHSDKPADQSRVTTIIGPVHLINWNNLEDIFEAKGSRINLTRPSLGTPGRRMGQLGIRFRS